MTKVEILKSKMKTKFEAIEDFPIKGKKPEVLDDRAMQALAEGIYEFITEYVEVLPGSFVTLPQGGAIQGKGQLT